MSNKESFLELTDEEFERNMEASLKAALEDPELLELADQVLMSLSDNPPEDWAKRAAAWVCNPF